MMDSESIRILLIEDGPGDALQIRRWLGDEKNLENLAGKIELFPVNGFDDALAALNGDGIFDLIFLDLASPENEGAEAVRQMGEKAPGVPIVGLDNRVGRAPTLDLIEVGKRAYLMQGVTEPGQLVQFMRAVVRPADLDDFDAKYAHLLDTVSNGIILYDQDGRILAGNPEACRILGYRPEELLTLGIQDLVVEGDLAAHLAGSSERHPEGRFFIEAKFRHADGTILRMEMNANQVAPGQIQAVLRRSQSPEAVDPAHQRQISELVMLHGIASAGAEATSVDELIVRAMDIIKNSLYPDNLDFLLVNDENVLQVKRSYRDGKYLAEQAVVPIGKGVTGQVALTGQALLIPDVREVPVYVEFDPQTRSELCVPLRVGDRVTGVINAESARVAGFTENDERLLTTVAGQLATAIERVRLFEAEREQRRMVEALERLGLAISSTLELQDLLNLICEESLSLFDVDAAYVWLVQKDEMVGFAGFGLGKERFLEKRIPLSDEQTLGVRVIRDKRPIYVNDVANSDQINPELISLLNVKSILGVPLIKGDKAVGALMIVDTQRTQAFSDDDVEAAVVLGSQAAIAIENARLFEGERRRRIESETLRRATVGLTASLELDQVLGQILVHLEQIVPYDSAWIFLTEEDHIRAVAIRNLPGTAQSLNRRYPLKPGGVHDEIQRIGKPVIISDVRNDPRFEIWDGFESVRAWIGLPLIARSRVIGQLCMDNYRVGVYGESEAVLAQALANQAAMAIDNARLYQESQRQSRELAGLYESALATNSVLVTEALLARLRDQILQLLAPDSMGVFLYDEATDQFEAGLAVEKGADVSDMVGARFPVQEGGLTGWIIRNRRPLLVDDLQIDQLPIEPRHITDPARSWLGVPLIARDRLIGAITLQSFRPRAFSKADRRYLESLAAQVAIALLNARLFEEAQWGIARQKALNTIIQAASGASDLDHLLEIALDQTLLALNLQIGGIWVRELQLFKEVDQSLFPKLISAAKRAALDLDSFSQPFAISNWNYLDRKDPLWHVGQSILRRGIRATLAVPVQTNGKDVGGLAIAARQTRNWQAEEIELLEAIGRQIGVAYERIRLFKQTQSHAAFMERLVPLSEALNRSFTIAEVLAEIGRGAMSLLGVERSAVFCRTSDDQVTCPWYSGVSESYIEVVTTQARKMPGGQLLYSKIPVLLPDIPALPVDSAFRAPAEREQIQAAGLWPLVYEGKVVAAVACYYERPYVWSEAEREAMQTLARQAAIALENARLFDAERQRTRELARSNQLITVLSRAAAKIETVPDPKRVMHTVGRKLKELNVDCMVALFEKDSGELVVRYASIKAKNLARAEEISGLHVNGFAIHPERCSIYSEVVLEKRARFLLDALSMFARLLKDLPRAVVEQVFEIVGITLDTRAIFVPMSVDENVLGVFGMWGVDLKVEDVSAVSVFSGHLAIAIENARLYAAEQQRSAELEALRKASLQLTSSLEVEPVLEAILDQALMLVSAKDAHIFLFDGEQLRFGAAMWEGSLQGKPIAEPRPGGLTYRVARSGERIVVADVNAHPLYRDWPWGGAILSLPLRVGDDIHGVMNIAFSEPHEFDDAELRVLELLGDQAALALENARSYELARDAYEETRRRMQELAMLFDVSQSLASASLSLEQIATMVARRFVEVIGVPECSISLIDKGMGVLKIIVDIYVQNGDESVEQSWIGKTIHLDEYPATARVIETLQPLVVRASDPEADPAELAYMQAEAKKTLVILPLAAKGEAVGIIELEDHEQERDFSQNQLNLALTLANQAAVALDNARLFESLEARLNELSAISDVSAALRGAANVEEICEAVTGQASRLVQADRVILYLAGGRDVPSAWYGEAGLLDSADVDIDWVDQTAVDRILETGVTLHLNDDFRDPVLNGLELKAQYATGLCIPLRTTTGQAVGVLLAGWRAYAGDQPGLIRREDERVLETMAEIAANALQRARTHEELEAAYLQTVLSLARAVDARDSYTNNHSQRLAAYAVAVARRLDLLEEDIQDIRWAAQLHDIGKIGVPDSILRKPGALSEEEWVIMRRHPEIGCEIVMPVKKLAAVAPLIRSHQEKFDGTGYPDGLGQEDIPIGARILAVVDAYTAMTDERVYRRALSPAEAQVELKRCAGTQFDPFIVDRFLEVLAEEFEVDAPADGQT